MTVPLKSVFDKMLFTAMCAGVLALVPVLSMAAWEPEKQVEFIVPAGTSSSLDQTARLMQDIIVKHKLISQPSVVINLYRGAGAEGFLAIKNAKGDPHKLLIAGNTLFTTPLGTGVPFNWKDTTPVVIPAFEAFMLWTRTASYGSAGQYIEAVKIAGPGKMKMGGTGSRQEDHMLTFFIERATGVKFRYVPLRFGSDVATQLAEGDIDSSVNNPVEAEALWRAGTLTPHCVFNDARVPYKTKGTNSRSWNDIPTCKEAGIPVDFQSPHGIFMPPGATQDQVNYYIELIRKITATPEWKDYMEKGAFNQTFMTGKAFDDWLGKMEDAHRQLMSDPCGGFVPRC